MCSQNDYPPYVRLAQPTCDALTIQERVRAGGYGMEHVPCQQERGLTVFVDYAGVTRRACAAAGHHANVVRRFGVRETEPEWLHETVR